MAKIFGIADLGVGTIADVVQINSNGQVPPPELGREIADFTKMVDGRGLAPLNSDVAQLPTKKKVVANPFIKMRNGFGKLMNHFSKAKPKI